MQYITSSCSAEDLAPPLAAAATLDSAVKQWCPEREINAPRGETLFLYRSFFHLDTQRHYVSVRARGTAGGRQWVRDT
jgi:hypothetical protein